MDVTFRKPFERLTNIDGCRLVTVIEVKSLVGEGDGTGTPIRPITEYYSTEGELLARQDVLLNGELEKGVWTKDPMDEETTHKKDK